MTSVWCHDLKWPQRCRDTDLMSRHRWAAAGLRLGDREFLRSQGGGGGGGGGGTRRLVS